MIVVAAIMAVIRSMEVVMVSVVVAMMGALAHDVSSSMKRL